MSPHIHVMEKKLLIVKNTTEEGPGLLEELLLERGIAYYIADLQQGEPFPEVENYQAVVVLGGPDSANDENEKMHMEQERIREILAVRIPYLGICLGLQTLVKAAGGKVVKSPLKEVGFKGPDGNYFSVELTQEGKNDPLFKGLEHSFQVFHFELTAPMFESWITEDPDLLQLDKESLRADLDAIKASYTQVGRQLLQNFLEGAGF